MDRVTDAAYSFIDSAWVRDRLKAAGVTFSPEQALPLVFCSDRPQAERFPAMLEILAGMHAPQAEELTALLNELSRLTDPSRNDHCRFRERCMCHPRTYLTLPQLMRSIRRDESRENSFSIISRGRRVAPVVYINSNGIADIECGRGVGRLLNGCPVSGRSCALPEIFAPGDIVRDITTGARWVVISADISSLDGELCDIIDFSAMVVPYEYRGYATPELIRAHFAERRQDVITEQHEHIYLPFLEPDRG